MGQPRFDRLDLPRDGRELMKFAPPLADHVQEIMSRVRARGGWRTTQDIPFRIQDPEFLAYWIMKSADPVRHPKSGSGLEARLPPMCRWRCRPPAHFAAAGSIVLAASGDLMRSPGLAQSGDGLYSRVADIVFGGDLCFANLESTLSGAPTAELAVTGREAPCVNASREEYATLVHYRGRRFDVLQLANNHILDDGERGVDATLAALRADGIHAVGINPRAPEAARAVVTSANGLRIGWVAHTFSVNERPVPVARPNLVNITPFHVVADPDIGPIVRQIAAARADGCDLVIAAMHWGLEFELFPHPDQVEWAHAFAEAGADLVIGHHPHVIQPLELYSTAGERSRVVPILYSLGNLTPPVSHPACVLSVTARIELVHGRLDGVPHAFVGAVELVPLVATASASGGGLPVLLPLREALREPVTRALQADLGEMVGYAEQVLGPDWRES